MTQKLTACARLCLGSPAWSAERNDSRLGGVNGQELKGLLGRKAPAGYRMPVVETPPEQLDELTQQITNMQHVVAALTGQTPPRPTGHVF